MIATRYLNSLPIETWEFLNTRRSTHDYYGYEAVDNFVDRAQELGLDPTEITPAIAKAILLAI